MNQPSNGAEVRAGYEAAAEREPRNHCKRREKVEGSGAECRKCLGLPLFSVANGPVQVVNLWLLYSVLP